MSLLPPAVIPTFLSLGPLALLALILPAAFAGLALFLRRWLALLATASVVSLLFLVHACLPGLSGTDGVAGPRVLHAVLAGVAALGSLWAVNRAYRKRESERLTLRPRTLEVLFLASLALIGAGWLFVPFPSGGPPQAYRKETTAAWASVALGAAYALGRWLAPQRTGGEPRGPTVEAVVLATFALGCGVLAATPRPAGAPSPIAVAWTFEPPARGAIISTPLVAGDRIYVGVLRDSGVGTARGAVYGLARDSGHVVWTFDDSKSMRAMYSSPCLSNGRLYIGEGMHGDLDSKLYCLDAATGAKLWDFRTSGHVESSPCVAEGRVLFGAGDDGLYALDAATGARRWHFHGDFHIDASPAVVAGRVYVGSGESRRYPPLGGLLPRRCRRFRRLERSGPTARLGLASNRGRTSLLRPGQRPPRPKRCPTRPAGRRPLVCGNLLGPDELAMPSRGWRPWQTRPGGRARLLWQPGRLVLCPGPLRRPAPVGDGSLKPRRYRASRGRRTPFPGRLRRPRRAPAGRRRPRRVVVRPGLSFPRRCPPLRLARSRARPRRPEPPAGAGRRRGHESRVKRRRVALPARRKVTGKSDTPRA